MNRNFASQSAVRDPAAIRALIRGMLAFALVAVCRGAAGPAQVAPSQRPPVDLARLEPGVIAVVPGPKPAAFGFQPAKGRVEPAGDGAANAVQRVLQPPRLGHPELEGAVGVLEFAAAPFVAAYGAVNSAGLRLLPDQLAAAEQDLTAAMGTMADQQHLCRAVLQSARGRTRRRLVAWESRQAISTSSGLPAAVLETQVQELRLERTGAGDGTYRLLVRARVRLTRGADGAELLDRSYEYRSGQAMFVDWTRYDGFASVARTACYELAERIAAEVFSIPPEQPILLGAGYKTASGQALAPAKSRPCPRARPPGSGMRAPPDNRGPTCGAAGLPASRARGVTRAGRAMACSSLDTRHPARAIGCPAASEAGCKTLPVLMAANEPTGRLPVAVADEPPARAPAVTLYLESPGPSFHFQAAPTTSEEPENASNTADWDLDGLATHPNSVVQGLAGVAALPFGLWEQTVGAVRRRLAAPVEAVSARLQEVVWETPPQQGVADELGRCLGPLLSKPMVVLKGPFGPEADKELAAVPGPAGGGRVPDGQAQNGVGNGAETKVGIEIRVMDVRLERSHGSRRRLVLCLEAQATLFRVSDGQELCVLPLRYRSAQRRLADWTGKDARLFRDELAQCCREMGGAIAQQFVSRGLASPKARSPFESL